MTPFRTHSSVKIAIVFSITRRLSTERVNFSRHVLFSEMRYLANTLLYSSICVQYFGIFVNICHPIWTLHVEADIRPNPKEPEINKSF